MKRVMVRMKAREMQNLSHSTRNTGFLLRLSRASSRLDVVTIFPAYCGVVLEDDGGVFRGRGPLAICFPALDHGLCHVGEVDGDGGGEALDDDFTVDRGVHG